MKKKLTIKQKLYMFLTISAVAILQSCVVYRPDTSQLVTVPDIVQMSNDGMSSKDIIRDIRQSHTAYDLKADQLVKLHEEGVQDSVINYMEETKIDLVRQNQSYESSSYWWPYDGFYYGGFGWGWPYGYYGYGGGPAIIYNYNRGYGGEYRGRGSFHGGGEYHGGGSVRNGGGIRGGGSVRGGSSGSIRSGGGSHGGGKR
jgi:hypothetical protein